MINKASAVSHSPSGTQATEQLVSLEQRAGLKVTESKPAPEFERFYTEFLRWLTSVDTLPRNNIQRYLKSHMDALGERAFRTTKEQMTVLTQVMARMKEQGLENEQEYKEVKTTYGQLVSVNFYIQDFMQQIFNPSEDDDDSRENINW